MNPQGDQSFSSFDKLGVVGRIDNDQVIATLESLCDLLLARKKQVYLDKESSFALGNFNGQVRGLEMDELCQTADLLIVVGGDGTLLSCGRSAAKFGTPLVGVNRGKLGFLTDINPQELDKGLGSILKGEFIVDERFLLEANLDGKYQGLALNDIVLNSGMAVQMIEYELYVDGKFVYSQSSDGLIISTPTGSTAYALSGGGPIMHPSLDAIVLVPICPHTLSSRPMVIDGGSKIQILPNFTSRQAPQIACDGQETLGLEKGTSLEVSKSRHRLTLLHPKNHEFYEACRSKLGWGQKLV